MNEYNDLLTKKDPKTKKNGIEAAGIASIFSKTPISPSDESVKMVNFETLMSSIGTLSENIALNARVIEACSYARMGVAAADFVGTIMSFVPILGQATTAIHIVAKVVGKIAIGVAVGTVVSFIVPKIIDQVIANITKNAATDWVGLDYGNALASGAIKYLGGNFQTGGGTAASEETFLVYNRYKEQVLAEAAEIDRFTRSPFDISSKNTFLGSIVYNLIPFANASTISGSLKTFGGLISNSFSNILPSASAIAETNLMESVGECPLLESVGLIGDAFCNPYYITNTSTIAESPESIEQKVAELDPSNFSGTNSNGTKKINPKSSLGKKILVCDQRVAALGIADASATNILVKQPSALVANTVLIGDIAEFISASKQAENMPWISGEACGDSPNNPYREEIETYQRYTEDLRLFEAAGIIEKSPVTSMLEDYYQENPLDNSYEGVLARYSGLEKDDVIAALDYIDALTYLANYNPSLREDFNRTSETETTKISPIERAYAKMNTNGEQLGLFTERRGFFSRKEHELLA